MNIIHIGFPKTATTFLQQYLFRQLPESVNYTYNQETRDLFFKLCNEDDSILNIEEIKISFNKILKDNFTSTNLFSNEPLTGLHYQTAFVNRTLIANRLKSLGFDKVIITIRNQYDVLDSTYKQYIKSGGVLRFNEYIIFNKNSPRYFFHPDYFNYYETISLYSAIFNFDNICVLQYEDLANGTFQKKLFNFLKVPFQQYPYRKPINKSISVRATKILRIINHFTYNSFRPSHLITKKFSTTAFYSVLEKLSYNSEKETFISNATRKEILNYFKDSNRKLMEKFNMVLDKSYPQ